MGNFVVNLKKTLNYLRINGLKATIFEVRHRMSAKEEEYILHTPDDVTLEKQRREAAGFSYRPLISAIIPLYNTNERMLGQLMESIAKQSYDKWEIIFADGSDTDALEDVISEAAGKLDIDSKLTYSHVGENKGIAGNTNHAIDLARGDYCALIDHDDFIEPDAFYEVVKKLNEAVIRPDLIYTDEDKCDENGIIFYNPVYKPDLDQIYLLCNNYICHMTVIKAELLKKLKLRPDYDGAQDHDLLIRAAIGTGSDSAARVVHIPKVLYHWRVFGGSTSGNTRGKLYAYEAGCNAVALGFEKLVTGDGPLDKEDIMGVPDIYITKHMGVYGVDYSVEPLVILEKVGAVGGLVVNKKENGMILAGPVRKGEEKCPFFTMPSPAGGKYNRRFISQECEVLDIRCLKLKEILRPLFEDVVGVPYVTMQDQGSFIKCDLSMGDDGKHCVKREWETIFDYRTLPAGTDYDELSKKLCSAIRQQGYRLVYIPEWETIWK